MTKTQGTNSGMVPIFAAAVATVCMRLNQACKVARATNPVRVTLQHARIGTRPRYWQPNYTEVQVGQALTRGLLAPVLGASPSYPQVDRAADHWR